MRRYFAVFTYDYGIVMDKIKTMNSNDFAASYERDYVRPFYVVSENTELSEWLSKLDYALEMPKNDLWIYIHKIADHYEIIGNKNMVREGGI